MRAVEEPGEARAVDEKWLGRDEPGGVGFDERTTRETPLRLGHARIAAGSTTPDTPTHSAPTAQTASASNRSGTFAGTHVAPASEPRAVVGTPP